MIPTTDGNYPPVVGAGAELYEEEDDSDDSDEWETDSDGGGMAEDDAVAKAKAAAKRIKAEKAFSSSGAAGKGKASRSSQPVGTGGLTGLDAAMAELDMDNYDDDEDGSDGDANAAALSANPLHLPAGVFSAGTQYYSSNKEDPYLKFGKGPKKEGSKSKGKGKVADDDSDFASSSEDEEETDEDDLDDWQLRPGSDLLLLAARNEDDVSHLEVWVCEPPGTTMRDGSEEINSEANVYVHHDVLLAAFPLCLAWMDAAPGSLLSSSSSSAGGTGGSFVAVGTMEPGIEIWDVSEADAVEPVAVLGPAPFAAEARAVAAAEAARAAEDSEDGDGRKSTNNKKKNKKSSKQGGPAAPATPTPSLPPPPSSLPRRRSRKDAAAGGGHADAVLGLAWNGAFRNVLASASADRTVKIWDLASVGGGGSGGGGSSIGIDGSASSGGLSSNSPVVTFCHHSGKVQAVAFNPADPPVLLTGGFDGTAALVDVRSPAGTKSSSSSSNSSVPSWKVGADVEALAWDPSTPTDFYVAAEDGVVSCFDARSAGAGAKPKFRLSAHSKAATALAFAGAGAGSAAAGGSSSPSSSCVAPGLLATGSTDKKVKLWDVSGGAPELVSTADLKVGAVFGLGFGGLDLSAGGRPPRPLLAAAGAKGTVAVWDVAADEAVARRWRKTLG